MIADTTCVRGGACLKSLLADLQSLSHLPNLPVDSIASASRSLRMICSGCRSSRVLHAQIRVVRLA